MGRVYKKMQKTCERCGSLYPRHRKFSRAQWAASKFCGQACSGESASEHNARRRPELEDKFRALFSKGDGCWEWQGTIDGYGYGVIDHNRVRYRAHILALEYDGRPVPAGMLGCHHCDNPKCVRPDHLYPGTEQDNSDDARARGRLAVGEKNWNAKLTAQQVTVMRSMRGVSFADLARLFGVSRPTATRAFQGKTWRHVK